MSKHKLAFTLENVDKAAHEWNGYLVTVTDTRRTEDQYEVTINTPRPISACFQTTDDVEVFLSRTISPYTPNERVWEMIEDDENG